MRNLRSSNHRTRQAQGQQMAPRAGKASHRQRKAIWHWQPSSIWQPLSCESCHHSSIHMHWPISQCNRIKEKFSSAADGLRAAEEFAEAYSVASGGVKICTRQPRLACDGPISWFVIPFDFVLGNSRVQQLVNTLRVPYSIGAFQRV